MGIVEYILSQIAKVSPDRPIFAICSHCRQYMRTVSYNAVNPGISHGMHRDCMAKLYGEEVAARAFNG